MREGRRAPRRRRESGPTRSIRQCGNRLSLRGNRTGVRLHLAQWHRGAGHVSREADTSDTAGQCQETIVAGPLRTRRPSLSSTRSKCTVRRRSPGPPPAGGARVVFHVKQLLQRRRTPAVDDHPRPTCAHRQTVPQHFSCRTRADSFSTTDTRGCEVRTIVFHVKPTSRCCLPRPGDNHDWVTTAPASLPQVSRGAP